MQLPSWVNLASALRGQKAVSFKGLWRWTKMIHDACFFFLGLLFLLQLWVATFFVGNVLALLSLSFVRPVNQILHVRLLDTLAHFGWGMIVDFVEHVGRLSPVITGDLEALSKHSHPLHNGSKIVISNHATAGDPLALFLLGHRLERIGNMRFMVRKDLLFFPVLGLTAFFLDFVFLSREWNKDQKNIGKVFRSMMEGTGERIFWMCMFPEGTRISPQKLRDSQQYAASKNLPVLQHVLVPRVKGLQATLKSLRAKADGVLDVTIAYSVRGGPESGRHGRLANGGAIRPGLGDLLLHRSTERSWPVHIHVRLIPMSDIPLDEQGVHEWVLKVFQEKDALLRYFNVHGHFPG